MTGLVGELRIADIGIRDEGVGNSLRTSKFSGQCSVISDQNRGRLSFSGSGTRDTGRENGPRTFKLGDQWSAASDQNCGHLDFWR